MADEDKYLFRLLGSLEYVMLLLILICVIWLLVRKLNIKLDVNMNDVKPSNYTQLSNSN